MIPQYWSMAKLAELDSKTRGAKDGKKAAFAAFMKTTTGEEGEDETQPVSSAFAVLTPGSTTLSTSEPEMPSQKDKAVLAVARHLEANIEAEIHAVNIRSFGPDSALYTDKHPEWQGELHALVPGILTTQDFVDRMRALTTKKPDFHVLATEYKSEVDLRAGTAHVFLNTETYGLWEGVTRSGVAICGFVRDGDGTWLQISYRLISGVNVMNRSAAPTEWPGV